MKVVEKLFTKNQKNIIMKENYNPFEVKKFTKEGLVMNITDKEILCEIMTEKNFLKRILVKAFKKDFINVYKDGVKKGFNWSNNVR